MARPKQYETPEDMQEDIDRYFFDCYQNSQREKKDRLKDPKDIVVEEDDNETFYEKFIKTTTSKVPTIAGLALALNMSRQSLINYERTAEFFVIIERAKLRVEEYNEQGLHGSNAQGIKFILLNGFGWKDKNETELTGPGGGPLQNKMIVEFVDPPDRGEE